jgi:protease-4
MTRQIERAFRRRDVNAVVLRIESPGGTSIGSDLIHHALVRMRGDTGKPLIVSMGGVAASGGYHIALPGQKIFADRNTATGSIGVVFVKPSLEGWYAKHDVRQDVFERGRYMRGLSLGEDWDREIQASADSANLREYREFVELVARSRNLTFDQAQEAAQGRVWLGDDALEKRLIDAIGGLEEAIAEARRRAKIPGDEKLAIAEYRRPRPGIVDRVVGSLVRETLERDFRVPSPGESMEWMEDDIAE